MGDVFYMTCAGVSSILIREYMRLVHVAMGDFRLHGAGIGAQHQDTWIH